MWVVLHTTCTYHVHGVETSLAAADRCPFSILKGGLAKAILAIRLGWPLEKVGLPRCWRYWWRQTSGAAVFDIGSGAGAFQNYVLELGLRAALWDYLVFYLLVLGPGSSCWRFGCALLGPLPAGDRAWCLRGPLPLGDRAALCLDFVFELYDLDLFAVDHLDLVLFAWRSSSTSTTWCPTTWTSSSWTSSTSSTTPWTSSTWSFACSNYVFDSRKLDWHWHPARLQHPNLQWDALRVPRVPTENQALHG